MVIMKGSLFQIGSFPSRFSVRLLLRTEGHKNSCVIHLAFYRVPLRVECLARFLWGYRVGWNMGFAQEGRAGICSLF
jgi:hypothetical protein